MEEARKESASAKWDAREPQKKQSASKRLKRHNKDPVRFAALMPSASHALPGLEGCNIGEAAEAGPESAQILTMRQRLILLSPG